MADAVMQLSPQVQNVGRLRYYSRGAGGICERESANGSNLHRRHLCVDVVFQFSPVEGDVERLGPARDLARLCQSGLDHGFGLAGDGGGDIAHRYS